MRFAALAASPAAAAGISFTWNPSGTSGPISNQGSFTANNLVVSDYATITINPADLNHIQETAILPVTQYQLNGTQLTLAGNPFTLYFYVTATSSLNGVPNPGNAVNGCVLRLTYTLYGVAGTCTFAATTVSPTATCGSAPLVLATGSLNAPPGPNNNVSVINGDPAAHAEVSSLAGVNAGTFFVSPSIGSFDFNSSFTNDSDVFTQTTVGNNQVITINGGGGNVDPDPGSDPGTRYPVGLRCGSGWCGRPASPQGQEGLKRPPKECRNGAHAGAVFCLCVWGWGKSFASHPCGPFVGFPRLGKFTDAAHAAPILAPAHRAPFTISHIASV